MLIKKPNKIRSYEITSENYLNRRSFIQSGCLIAGGILQGIHSANLPISLLIN